ncbi:hypothetical protein JCM8097_000712 [Rhodosporidiobolus ruineniae]
MADTSRNADNTFLPDLLSSKMDIHRIVDFSPFRFSQLARLGEGLVPLDIPPDAPALFQTGTWRVGRIGSQGFDRLALVWDGFKGRITLSNLTLTFHDCLSGSKIAKTRVFGISPSAASDCIGVRPTFVP